MNHKKIILQPLRLALLALAALSLSGCAQYASVKPRNPIFRLVAASSAEHLSFRQRIEEAKALGPNGELSDIQQAFVDEAAVQCGFCTPGFIMTAVEVLETGKEYTRDELRKLLSGHLCRCTGYENILNAVEKTMKKRLGKA